jgi:hypothetical protein
MFEKEYTTMQRYSCGHVVPVRTLGYKPKRVFKGVCPKCWVKYLYGYIQLPGDVANQTLTERLEFAKSLSNGVL